MTTVQRVAQIFGVVFILIGLLGFFLEGGTSMVADPEPAPELLGLFPVNLLHNLAHLGLGVWGVAASRSWSASRLYNRAAGSIYLLLTVLAFVTPTTFGLMPIGGNDIWLHALLAAVQLYFGFTARAPVVAGGAV